MKRRHIVARSRYLTTGEAARYLRIHRSTVYRLIRQNQIPAFKIGTDWRLDRDALEKWMAERTLKGK
jgi:excisionase family DNA binding protein